MNKKPFKAILACMECGATYDIHSVRYTCDACGGLLNVEHDTEALKTVSPQEWKNLFSSRYREAAYPFDSGIWGKKEWVLPEIDNEHIVSLGEGAGALVPFPRLAKEFGVGDFRVKQCGHTHTGSFKDLGMTVLVSHVKSLISKGHKIRAVAAASSGDTSAALAAYGAMAGIPVIVFLPAGRITTAQLVQPLSNGALVLSLDTDFDGCMKIVKEVTSRDGIYLANSMNPLRIEGQKTLSIEIVQQLGWNVPDWIVIPGGNLGNVAAVAAGFRMMKEVGLIEKVPRVLLAQAANANPMYLSYKNGLKELIAVQAKKTLASAIQIGNPVSYPRAKKALEYMGGSVLDASEDELADAAAVCDRFGMFTDPHTAVAVAALRKAVKEKIISSHESTVVVSTAHGLKFSEFKSGYHEGVLEDVTSRYPNQPKRIKADADAVSQEISLFLKKF